MAKGRPPKPTKLRLIEGNPGKRPINEKEPKPDIEIPKRPTWLSKEAKKEWNRITRELDLNGMISKLDLAMLATYCQSFGDWVKHRKLIAEEGDIVVIRDDKGNVKYMAPTPSATLAQRALENLRKIGSELGLSAAARSRIKIDFNKKPQSKLERLLS